MIKIVFSDMDGTLLDGNGQLPPDFDEVIQELKKRGVIFAPASGRQYYALTYQMAKYKGDFAFLGENGSYSMYKGKEIYSNTIPRSIVDMVLERIKNIPHIYASVCGKKDAYVLRKHGKMKPEAEKYYSHLQFVDSYDEIDDDILKVALCDFDNQDAEKNFYPYLTDLKAVQQVILSSPIWIDIMNPDANKGRGVQATLDYFGFKPEEAAAFGDYMNDCEMLRKVKYSYAMGNALPAVKEIANFVTKCNTEYGVTWQLKQLMQEGLI